MPDQKTCFVVMGFGKKTDFQTSRVLDLDKSYRNIIRPAAQQAGCLCLRADEIVHSGTIDVPMYDQLLNADVVVADLSTANCNAFYELGVRHALRPYTTIIIAEEKMVSPFDVNHIVIRRYQHLGDVIDYDEVIRMQGELRDAITIISQKPAEDSPVYVFVKGLKPPFKEIAQAVAATAPAAISAAISAPAPAPPPADIQTVSTLMDQAQKAIDHSDFQTAQNLMSVVKGLAPRDPYVTQKLAMATYKSKLPDALTALNKAKEILQELNPEDSTDTETLGLWGAIHKRLFEINQDTAALETSLTAYDKAFTLKKDYWNGINVAFLYMEHKAVAKDPDDALADKAMAKRIWRGVLAGCEPLRHSSGMAAVPKYWLLATMSEACLGLGDTARSQALLDEANALQPADWMKETTAEQRAKLEKLL